MLISWLLFAWVMLAIRGIKYEGLNSSILTKHEFCNGNHHVKISPKYIPLLLDYLRYCSTSSKEPNIDSFARRQAVIHLFNAATPVLHKAFFDSKTALKYVVSFTKLKHEAVQYANYANKYGDHSIYSRKKVANCEGTLTYAADNDEGSYNLNEDLRLCASIVNRQRNASVKNIIKPSQLPRVAKAARIITFPPFNLSVAVSSEDTPYMILDMYVLAMRCLSFTNLHPNTTAQVSEHIISNLKKKVMPFIPPNEFERAYSGMMSMARAGSVGTLGAFSKTLSTQRHTVKLKSENPLKMQSLTEDITSEAALPNEKDDSTTTDTVSSSTKKSFRQVLLDLLKKKPKTDGCVVAKQTCMEGCQNRALMFISGVLGISATVAILLYCLLFGCCGLCAAAKDGDEVDARLAGYARFKQQNKCYCTLADSNQMEIIAALHHRCELLSKKICAVVKEISKENIFDNPESMDVLREFVRSVSFNMVDENETIHHFGKSMTSLIKPQNKITSVNRNTFRQS